MNLRFPVPYHKASRQRRRKAFPLFLTIEADVPVCFRVVGAYFYYYVSFYVNYEKSEKELVLFGIPLLPNIGVDIWPADEKTAIISHTEDMNPSPTISHLEFQKCFSEHLINFLNSSNRFIQSKSDHSPLWLGSHLEPLATSNHRTSIDLGSLDHRFTIRPGETLPLPLLVGYVCANVCVMTVTLEEEQLDELSVPLTRGDVRVIVGNVGFPKVGRYFLDFKFGIREEESFEPSKRYEIIVSLDEETTMQPQELEESLADFLRDVLQPKLHISKPIDGQSRPSLFANPFSFGFSDDDLAQANAEELLDYLPYVANHVPHRIPSILDRLVDSGDFGWSRPQIESLSQAAFATIGYNDEEFRVLFGFLQLTRVEPLLYCPQLSRLIFFEPIRFSRFLRILDDPQLFGQKNQSPQIRGIMASLLCSKDAPCWIIQEYHRPLVKGEPSSRRGT